MRSSHGKLDFYTMSVGMLQEKRDAYMRLKAQGNLLPDGGKKLDDAIELIDSILDRKKSQPSSEPQRIPIFKTFREEKLTPDNIPKPIEVVSESEDEELKTITSGFRSIDISDDSFEDGDEEDLSKFPDDPLTPHEIDQYLGLCKLPSIRFSDQTICHPFVLHLGLISSNSIHLRVIDCLNTENTFFKFGTPTKWNLTSKSSENGGAKIGYKPTISHPGCALSDLWNFVHNSMKNNKNWPVFLFESQKILNTFKSLYCSSSVQHYPGAKNLPRNIRFVVNVSPVCEEFSQKANGAPGDITASDDHLTVFAEIYSKEIMTSLSLSKMKSKSVAWLELNLIDKLQAPLNYRALLRISKIPANDIVTKLSDSLATTQIGNSNKPHEPQATSAPILNSIDDALLRRLALTGFVPRTLALLAAKGGWRGFVGLLSALGISKDSPEPLSELYRCFMKVNRGLAINADLYKEDAKKVSIKNLYSESERKTKTLLKPLPIQPEPPEDRIKITMPPASDALLKFVSVVNLLMSYDSSDPQVEEEKA
ncbi:unnamed protein product [Hymenolepis diminuta]|uniref:Protein kinase domain-containing protein n=1 Tax=Hymenolepis diminuta TaxID=6216 RepID=A0A0R3SV14_HYMDI|nr:unnamed protein product [Hymenolepis diminuta]